MSSRPKVLVTLVPAIALFGLLAWAGVALANHPHGANLGARSQTTSLVPAFEQCGGQGGQTPDRQHGPPLQFPSCSTQTPADLTSNFLTVGGQFSGRVSLNVICTNAENPPCPAAGDQQDVRIVFSGKDVRCQRSTSDAESNCGPANAAGGTDYHGTLAGSALIRITDHFNRVPPEGPLTQSATMVDIPFGPGARCVSTASTSMGSNCNITTSADAIAPGLVKESKQANVELGQIQIFDGGPDGQHLVNPPINRCPPACIAGAGDTKFLVEGIYIP